MAHPYDAFIHRVEKPARYLGGELHSIRKPWESTPIRVALAFPDAYELGMSHLGLRILYDHLNRDPSILAERVFAPWLDLEAELRASGTPLVSLESARPLGEFDCIGFSLQYELTFTNVLNMLDLSGIPLHAAERDDSHPLIVAGGPVATQPEPMAPFIDCFVIGDGEEYFPRLLKLAVEWRRQGLPRLEALERLAALGGIYCPALYDVETDPLTGLQVVKAPNRPGAPARVVRRIVEDLSRYPFPAVGPVPST
ncbi:MAG: TIGR03960 family B12-binding radical SAM protein, partial [Thermoanaerobaculia bacterium]